MAALVLAAIFVAAILDVDWPDGGIDDSPPTSEEVARSLFSDDTGYGLVVLLIGLLLLVAMLGGIFLAKEERP